MFPGSSRGFSPSFKPRTGFPVSSLGSRMADPWLGAVGAGRRGVVLFHTCHHNPRTQDQSSPCEGWATVASPSDASLPPRHYPKTSLDVPSLPPECEARM